MTTKKFDYKFQIPKGQYWECPACHKVRIPSFKPASQDEGVADWTAKRILHHIQTFHGVRTSEDWDRFITHFPVAQSVFGVALKKDGSADKRYTN